jgi:hypothetical protein
MKNILQDIKATISSLRSGKINDGKPSTSSIKWFSKKVQSLKTITKGAVNPQNKKVKTDIINDGIASKTFRYKKSGYVYFFNYIPPNAKQLAFYDEFPMVLSLGFSNNKLIGINLHYLPTRIRLYVVYKIVKSMSSTAKEGTRIKVQSLLTSRTIRKYIMILGEEFDMRGIRSKIKLVSPDEFLTMSFLPVQKFRKKQQPQVTQQINKIFRGTK